MMDIEMTGENGAPGRTFPLRLSSMESDTIGEILNISMGAAATAVSTLLKRKVSITTPAVSISPSDRLEYKSLEPATGIEIEYEDGLSGSNYMIMKKRDIKTIVNLLLGEMEGADGPEASGELDEIHLSAMGEIMNQMMGASSTALAAFFGKGIKISIPRPFEPEQIAKKLEQDDMPRHVVSVRFFLKVEGILDSEFITLMPVEFTKELVANALNFADAPETAAPGGPAEQEQGAAAPLSPAPPAQNGAGAKEGEALSQGRAAPSGNAAGPASGPAAAGPRQVSVRPLSMANLEEEEDPLSRRLEEGQDNLSLILGVPLEVSVEIGRTQMSVQSVLDIRQGTILELDRQAGDSFDVIVNGKLIAKGDVVIIDDNFGVRITEII